MNPTAATRISFSSSALAPTTTKPYIEFLDELNELEQRQVVLIWDGLPSHHSGRMRDWIASQRDWLRVEPLPGHAHDLNPIEQVWGSLRSKELRNLCPVTPGCAYDHIQPGISQSSFSIAGSGF